MTKAELDISREEKSKNRFKSRTFWLNVTWIAMIPLAIISQLFIPTVILPLSTIITFAGSVTLLYIGGNKGLNIAETLKIDPEVKLDPSA